MVFGKKNILKPLESAFFALILLLILLPISRESVAQNHPASKKLVGTCVVEVDTRDINFRPDDPITREQMILMLARA